MASSNRHWPSLFKSKPQQHHQCQQQHEHNKTSCDSASEDRNKELKPRWNPKAEQIRILEAIFNSGMINPPRDEIRRIRVELQEFGEVGDANVFYWFQNRKSRTKHKQQQQQQRNTTSNCHSPTTTAMMAPSTKSSPKASSRNKMPPLSVNIMTHNSFNSPTPSVNFHPTTHGELVNDPFFFPVLSGGTHACNFSQGFSFPQISANVVHHPQTQATHHHTPTNHSNLLLSDLMMNDGPVMTYNKLQNKQLQQQQLITYSAMPSNTIFHPPATTISSISNNVQGKSSVMINEVRFEVPSGPLNVKDAFGEDAVLVHSSGQPVVTDKWGLTLHPLQNGASYYLI